MQHLSFLRVIFWTTVLLASFFDGSLASQAGGVLKARRFETSVYRIEEQEEVSNPVNISERLEILSMQDGRIYWLSSDRLGDRFLKLKSALVLAKRENRKVTLTILSDDQIIEVELGQINPNRLTISPKEAYEPSVLSDYDSVKKLFHSVWPYSQNTIDASDHCFDRAHFWSRSYEVQSNVKSEKVFVFFTQSYRRRAPMPWWFHVAPAILERPWWAPFPGQMGQTLWVMDSTFFSAPVTVADWIRYFMPKQQRACVEVRSLEEYELKQQTEDCVTIRAPMYAYGPDDLSQGAYPSSQWRCGDFSLMRQGIPSPNYEGWARYDYLSPSYCP